MIIRQRKLTFSAAFLTTFLFCASHAVAQTTPVEITLHQFTRAAPANGGNPVCAVPLPAGHGSENCCKHASVFPSRAR